MCLRLCPRPTPTQPACVADTETRSSARCQGFGCADKDKENEPPFTMQGRKTGPFLPFESGRGRNTNQEVGYPTTPRPRPNPLHGVISPPTCRCLCSAKNSHRQPPLLPLTESESLWGNRNSSNSKGAQGGFLIIYSFN